MEYRRDELMDDEKDLLSKLFPKEGIYPHEKHYAVMYNCEGPGTEAAVLFGKHVDPAKRGSPGPGCLEITKSSVATEIEQLHTVIRERYVIQSGELVDRDVVAMRTWDRDLNLAEGFQRIVYDSPLSRQNAVESLSDLLAGLAEQQGLEKPKRRILERVHRGLPPSTEIARSR